jgi:microcystin-dependent protein
MSGTNTNLAGNVAIFTGAFTGSNTRLSGAESNVIALQGGLTGANTNISAITSSPVTFQSSVTILGNLTLSGNTTIVTSNTISFGDTLLSLGANNTVSDNLDIGLYGHYWNGTANSHSGIFRSAVSKDWMLFANYIIDLEGNSTVTISNSSFQLGTLRLANANAGFNVSAANAILGTSVYSGTVELRANDYATYLMAKGGIDAANTINTNQTTGLTGANTNITNLTSGLTGANTNLSGNVAIFTGAFTGSNTRLAGAESNVIALQGGLSGANTINTNQTTGLTGANTNITALTGGLTGANTNITALTGGLAGANTAIALRALADSPTFTGNATFDTTTLFVDSLNDRVGIGTTSPTTKFHVAGTNTTARIMVESTGTSGSHLPSLYFNRTSNVSSGADFQGSIVWSRTLTDSTSITSTIQSSGTNISGSQAMNMIYNAYTSHQFQINASDAMRIDSSGNVGIGTTSTSTYKLNVNGVANFGIASGVYGNNADMRLETSTGRGWRMGTTSTGSTHGYFYIQGSTDNFVSSFITGLFIDTSGNVGIGTSSPGYLLDVRGTANVGALTATGTVTLGSNTNVKITGGTNGQVLATDGSGNLSYIGVLTAASPTITGNAIFDTNTLFVDSVNKRVGLITTLPGFTLDVRGTANTGALTSTTVSSGGVELRANDYATYLMAKGGIDAANTINTNQTTGLTGANTNITALTGGLAGANTAIALRALAASPTFTGNATFDTNTLFVDSLNDRVGIGTTNPGYKLEVVNGYIYQSQTDGSMARIGLGNTNRNWTISNYGTSYSPNGSFNIADETAGAVRFQIDTSGNVGIGTNSPTLGKLQVVNSADSAVAYFHMSKNDAGSAEGVIILDDRGYSGVNSGKSLVVRTRNDGLNDTGAIASFETTGGSTINALWLGISGNVGVGTTSPGYLLDVRGTANVGALTTTGTVTLGSNTNVKITGGSSGQYLQTDGSGNLSYVTVQGVPVASIIMYGANTAPSGWLVCDGTAVSRSTYSGLFAVVSNVFGIGDNTTTFNLPDFRGRSPYGVDASQSITIGASSVGKINVNFQTTTATGTSGSTADTNTVTTNTTNSTTDKDVTNAINVVTGVTPIAHTHTIPALTVSHPAEVVQFIIKT